MASDHIFTNSALMDMKAATFLTKSLAQKHTYLKAKRQPQPSLVAIVPSGAMRSDRLYASGKTDNAPFYMPRFDLRREPNLPAVHLERLETGGNPSKPQGRLHVQVTQQGWIEPGIKCFPVDFELNGALRFDVPLEADLAFDHSDHKNFQGTFSAYDEERQGLVEMQCVVNSNMMMEVTAVFRFGQALWKPDFAFGRVQDASAVIYCTSAKRQVVLHVHAISSTAVRIDEHMVDGQNSWTSHHLFQRMGRRFDRAEQTFELAPFEVVSENCLQSVTDIWSSTDYVRIWQVATVADHNTRLDLKADVLVARKHVEKTFVGPKVFDKVREDMAVISIDRNLREIISTDDVSSATIAKFAAMLKAAPSLAETLESIDTQIIHRFKPQVRSNIAIDARHIEHAPVVTHALHGFRREMPTVTRGLRRTSAFPRQAEITTIRVGDAAHATAAINATRFIVPVEQDGTPKLSFRSEASVQSIAPFTFAPDFMAEQLDPPENTNTPLRLNRHDLHAGTRRATFYQDALEPDRITYEPESFELARADEAPFEPLLLFVLEEIKDVTSATPQFSVILTFQARPVIHPDLLAQARANFGDHADIRAIIPTVSHLQLMVPASSVGAAQSITIDSSEIDLTDGLIASVPLNEAQYHQVIAGFQTAGGTGLAGHIEVTLTDGTLTQIPVDLSVKDAVGMALQSHIVEVDDDAITVNWRNQIESPVRVLSMPPVNAGAMRLEPITPLPVDPIPAGGHATVIFRLTQGVADPDTDVIPEYTVEPDILAVLSQTTVVQGYDNDRFTITCSVDPMFFDFVPVEMEPLTALELSFRTLDETIVLTADAPSQQVELTMPKLLFLTSADAAQHYSVAVTNVHANGTRVSGPFQPGQGNLTVEPASGVI